MKKVEFISIAAIIFLIVMRLSTIDPGCDNSHDVFYHITMADLGPSFYMSDRFPSLTLSCWYDNFSDKELSFHLLLSGVRGALAYAGLPLGAPFHIEFLFFAILLVGSFIITARYFQIEKIYLYSLAMVSISPFFITRIVVLRPHLLSISLLVLSTVLFDLTNRWKRIWIPLLLGFVMAWSYSNPHFILLPAVAFGLSKLSRKQWQLAAAIPVITILGVVLGFIIHPQFPNTFLNWKIQCIDVVLVSLSKSSPVKIGNELSPGNLSFFMHNISLLILQLLNVLLMIFYVFKLRTSENSVSEADVGDGENVSRAMSLNKPLIAMYAISFISFAGMFAAVRAGEYAVPFSLLATGMLIKEYSKYDLFNFRGKVKKIIFVSAVTLLGAIMLYGGNDYYNRAKDLHFHPYTDFAKWLAESGIPQGEVIGNANWSDFPFLFYAAPNYRYLAGVDPMFAYFKYPAKMNRIELFRTGQGFLTPEKLFDATGTKYIFVSFYNSQLSEYMFKCGYVSIYQGEDGNLFDLQRSFQNIKKRSAAKLKLQNK
jgi:hypothetical protein